MLIIFGLWLAGRLLLVETGFISSKFQLLEFELEEVGTEVSTTAIWGGLKLVSEEWGLSSGLI
jgi:hypothetical protein